MRDPGLRSFGWRICGGDIIMITTVGMTFGGCPIWVCLMLTVMMVISLTDGLCQYVHHHRKMSGLISITFSGIPNGVAAAYRAPLSPIVVKKMLCAILPCLFCGLDVVLHLKSGCVPRAPRTLSDMIPLICFAVIHFRCHHVIYIARSRSSPSTSEFTPAYCFSSQLVWFI